MSWVSVEDCTLLLDCVRELHAFRDLAALRTWLLDTALPNLIPSDWLSYNEVDLLNPRNTMAILKPDPDSIFEKLFPRFKEVVHQHPLIVRQMQSVDFPVHKISDFLPQEIYHQSDLYRDVYRPMGVEYQIAAAIRLDPDHVTAFALSRRQQDYTERDRSVLELLRPHLAVAFNNLELHCAQQSLLDGAELALRELSSATVMVGPQGRILYHTGPGLQWIGATFPGNLPADVSAWLAKAPVGGWHGPLRFTFDHEEIMLRALPTSSPERRLLVLTRREASAKTGAVPAGLGLSQREMEVARWIGEGKSNIEIASILGISPRTVQKHIEHIFEKLGVETRVAIATRLLN